ncbi:mechanosensitive ion channel family protein [Bartonella sp. F02]|uniref:mechanosensitive ion channel family protein n=1 Tax=Bartonella sp. F02 TaxID=2967262 RepID=UPI0022A94136|nr:mechanosensitive ion channel domain-containing protein [Bartonella sp. F02]MCZ2328629.1 mechanosensitive ion channel [Bartonella sp. F02]
MNSFLKKTIQIFFLSCIVGNVFSSFAGIVLASEPAVVEQSETAHSIVDIIQQQQLIIEKLKNDVKALQQNFEQETEDERILIERRLQAQNINKRALESAFVLRDPLNEINILLNQLDGISNNKEDLESKNQERDNLLEQKVKINHIVRQFEEIFLATNKMVERAISQSRELFTRTLTHRLELSIPMIKNIIEKIKEASIDFVSLFDSWWKIVSYFKPLQLFLAFFIPLFSALGLSYFSHKAIQHVYIRIVKNDDEVPYLQRLLVAFISILFPALVCVFCVYFTFFLLSNFDLKLEKLSEVFYTIGRQIVFVFLVSRILVVLLSPKRTHMRLVNIAPLTAYQLIIFLTLLASILAFDAIFDSVYQAVLASLTLTIAKSFIAVFLVGILLLIISFMPLRFRRAHFQNEIEKSFPWPFYIRIPLIGFGLLLLGTDFLGYVGLARFIMQLIIVSGAFLVLMYLGIQSARAIASEGVFMKTSIGRVLMRWFHLEEKTMNQLGIVCGILLNFVVITLCAMPIITQFGFSYSDVMVALWQLMTGFQIGQMSISLISIIIGIIVFFIALFFIRFFVRWLDSSVMVNGGFDSGVRNSIKTVINYGGIAVSSLIGISIAGFDLKGFALIAGGLSLGIGFGLQNIVQNFVSGLIILIGRPFKLGDYIESGSVSGIVKRISVRATELETFQRKTIVIPNSNLINNNVSNWTRRNKMGRVDIPLTVSTSISPERVVEILLQIASVPEGVLKNPAPQVNFTAFDSKHFSFTLSIYVPNITSTSEITNVLRFMLYERFVKEGILE